MSRPRRWHSVTVWLPFWLANLFVAGCSLLVDNSAVQCESASDCLRFTGTTCDRTRHICIPTVGSISDTSPDGGQRQDGGQPATPSGMICPPDASTAPGLELLNSCSDSTCIPFDNRARLTNLASDGTLKPLPDLNGVQP